ALKPVSNAIALPALVITNGTPGAKVDLDNESRGTLDQSGYLKIANALTLGKHSVVIAKEGFESRTFLLDVKPQNDAILPDTKLSLAKTSLSFETEVKNVTIRYRREGESDDRETSGAGKVLIVPGSYEILATAGPEFEPIHKTVEVGREATVVPLKFSLRSGLAMFEDPNDVLQENEWFKSKNPSKFVPLRPGLARVNILFASPGRT